MYLYKNLSPSERGSKKTVSGHVSRTVSFRTKRKSHFRHPIPDYTDFHPVNHRKSPSFGDRLHDIFQRTREMDFDHFNIPKHIIGLGDEFICNFNSVRTGNPDCGEFRYYF